MVVEFLELLALIFIQSLLKSFVSQLVKYELIQYELIQYELFKHELIEFKLVELVVLTRK